jgi:DNA polymerase-3 subunit beta
VISISSQTADLVERLTAVSRVASGRSAMQPIAGVRLVAQSGSVSLEAVDADLAIRTELPATVGGSGSITLPGKLLLDVARALPAPTVEITSEEAGIVSVRSGSAEFKLRALRDDDVPPLPSLEGGEPVQLSARALRDTIAKVERAAARDATRLILTGVLVSATGDELRMVATDAYRLAVKETKLDHAIGGEGLEATVPHRALGEIAKANITDETQIELRRDANRIIVRWDGTTLVSRLLDGQFPNYRQLLQENFTSEVIISTKELSEALRRVSILAQKSARLRLKFTEGELEIAAETQDVGGAKETIPAPWHGDELEIGFNPDYLRAGLECVATETVRLRLINPVRPMVLEATDDSAFTYLVMPLRLDV